MLAGPHICCAALRLLLICMHSALPPMQATTSVHARPSRMGKRSFSFFLLPMVRPILQWFLPGLAFFLAANALMTTTDDDTSRTAAALPAGSSACDGGGGGSSDAAAGAGGGDGATSLVSASEELLLASVASRLAMAGPPVAIMRTPCVEVLSA